MAAPAKIIPPMLLKRHARTARCPLMAQSGTLAELKWTSVQHDVVNREPNNLSWVALVSKNRTMHMTEASTSFTPASIEGCGVYNRNWPVKALSIRDFAASFANLGIICCAVLSLLSFPALGLARDLDGK